MDNMTTPHKDDSLDPIMLGLQDWGATKGKFGIEPAVAKKALLAWRDTSVREASIALVCRIAECYVAVSTPRESYEPKRASSMRMLCEAHLGSGGEGDIPDYFDIDGKEITGQELIDAASPQAEGDVK